MDPSLDSLKTTLDRVSELALQHTTILRAYWDDSRSTFGLEGPRGGNHVTTSCTCVLSFVDSPERSLPDFLRDSRNQFIEWLLSTRWASEDLPEHNVYTTPIGLTTVLHLDPSRLSHDKCEAAARFLVGEVDRSEAGGGVQFQDYPASGFLTYWTVRALWASVAHYRHGVWRDQLDELRRAQVSISKALDWAEQEAYRQFSYFLLGDDRFDPLQMGYVVALTDLAREHARRPPDRKMVAKGLEILFATQLNNGLWPKGTALFHYGARGSVYPFSFETLTAVLRTCLRVSQAERDGGLQFFGPFIDGFLKTLAWAEANQVVHPELATKGWRSNNVMRGETPHAWATAMVLSFVRGLHAVVSHILRAVALYEMGATLQVGETPASLTRDAWTTLDDSETRLATTGQKVSVKGMIFDRLLQPHLAGHSPRLWSAIFFGPPGSAKTQLSRDIARALGWPLVSIGTSDFMALGADKMAHQARIIFKKLEQLFEAVILIDEVEEFVRDRAKAHEHESRLVTTAMLTLIQALREKQSCILILATNYLQYFDQAIMRPGRFDLVVFVPPPSFESKLTRFRATMKSNGIEIDATVERFLDKHKDVIERFTFHDWRAFLERVVLAFREAHADRVDDELLAPVFDMAAKHTTIKAKEWGSWKKRESYVYG